MCLQRQIWIECGCLYRKTKLPFYDEKTLCSFTEYADHIAYPKLYNISHCFASENMTTLPECEQMFHKLFEDLLCVRKVKERFLKIKPDSQKATCHCPDACDSFRFDMTYSLAGWPSDGPELDQAYKTIVQDKVIPHFQTNTEEKYNKSDQYLAVLNRVINYLSDSTKKKEIMSNFLRLTVYIEDLAVETIQDVVGYSEMDLLSDIGQ